MAYSAGSPSCNGYSRLKLGPGGPVALRTPDQSNGVPGLTFDQQLRLQSSATMLSRVVTCLILTYLSGGHCHLEQPSNAMSWLEPEDQSFISNVGIHCVMLAACAYHMDIDKSWIFATSLASLQQLGTTCTHPKGTHESINGSSLVVCKGFLFKCKLHSFLPRKTLHNYGCLDGMVTTCRTLMGRTFIEPGIEPLGEFLLTKPCPWLHREAALLSRRRVLGVLMCIDAKGEIRGTKHANL